MTVQELNSLEKTYYFDSNLIELRLSRSGSFTRRFDTFEPVSTYVKVSLTGQLSRGSWGQCQEEIAELYPDDEKIQRIVKLWNRWHLNDLRAGSQIQTEFLRKYEEEHPEELGRWAGDYYVNACKVLKAAGLYEDRGYKYGHEWLVEVVPDEVVEELISLFGGVQ